MQQAWEIISGYKIGWKNRRKRPLGRLRRRCEDNIKMDFKETELNGVDWIYLAQDRNK
jgi:hypothetical protein